MGWIRWLLNLFKKKPATVEWAQQGSVHKNGDRFVGRPTQRSLELWRRGTPAASIIVRSTVTEAVRAVRIDDELDVAFDGQWWQVSRHGEAAGRLSWHPNDEQRDNWMDVPLRYPRAGRLVVERLLVNREGETINVSGYVRPS